MTQVVQATCPHCKNVLRIPAEWLDKPMRCKFCRNIFEARPRTSDTPLPATAVGVAPVAKVAIPVAKAPIATAVSATPLPPTYLVITPQAAGPGRSPRPRHGAGNGKVLMLVGCAVVAVVGVPLALVALAMLGTFGAGIVSWNLPGIDAVEIGAGDRHQGGKDSVATGKDGKTKDALKDKKIATKDKKGPAGKEKYGTMPRRALLINVCNYLYLNRVDQGRSQTTSLSALKNHGISNAPLNIPPSQMFALSDEGESPQPTEISVIKNAIKDFCDTSRTQDRIIVLFAGHATEIDKDCYLIPIGGRKEDPDTLIPLTWVYDQLATCQARQKVLVLDAYRFPPARGFELPGAGASDEGEMGEVFDQALQNPPAGVQVWSSCIKGQRSIEFEGGSVFLQALSRVREGAAMTGIDEGKNPLAITDAFVTKVNERMKDLIGPGALVQTSRLTGKPADSGLGYDPGEPQALPITVTTPVVQGGDLASYAEINNILQDIKKLPVVKKSRFGEEDRLLRAVNLPPFPAKLLAKYKPDDNRTLPVLLDELDPAKDAKGMKRAQYAKEHPVRVAVVEAVEALSKSEHLAMRETLNGPVNDKQKAAFLNEQKEPGVMIFELEKVLGEMKQVAEEDMDKETSKRWRAHFDFTQARLKARLVYIYEYSFLLGQIRRDEMPALENGADGWRMASRKKIQCSEPKAKTYAKEVDKAWKQLQKDYRDTPWAILAYREGLISLGMEWKAKKE
jgi:hypothetical protein